MARWGDDKTIKFINLYREYECLWNSKSPLYKNKICRENSYRKIMEDIGDCNLTIQNIKTKIKGLRSTFHQKLKKINSSKMSRAGAANVYTPTLTWFKEMEFLKDTFDYRDTISTEVQQSSSQPDTDLDEQILLLSEASTEILEQPQASESILSLNSHDRPIGVTKKITQKKKRPEDDTLVVLEQLQNIATAINPKCHEDQFRYFGQSVAALRTLPLNNALNMQTRIQTLLSTERHEFETIR